MSRAAWDANAAATIIEGEIERSKELPSYTRPKTAEIGVFAKKYVAGLEGALDRVRSGRVDDLVTGRLYEVSLDVEPDQLLDWDKPFGQQPKAVQDILRQFAPAGDFDADVGIPTIQRIIENDQGAQALSEALRNAGVPGIRYLDQGSRLPFDPGAQVFHQAIKGPDGKWTSEGGWWAIDTKYAKKYGLDGRQFATEQEAEQALTRAAHEQGSRNYVIFDDSLVKIVAKDGKPVASE
jgi:hypothetical protein